MKNHSCSGDFFKSVRETALQRVPKDPNETASLVKQLKVGVDLNYETTHNMFLEDGIVNGSHGVVKKIDFRDMSNPIPSIIWMEFSKAETWR